MVKRLKGLWMFVFERRGTLAVSMVMAISLSMNVMLGNQLRTAERPIVRPAGVVVGTELPTLAGKSLDGLPATLTFERPTLLYVFSPSCTWCAKEYPNLIAISQAVGGRYEFVGLARPHEGLAAYVAERPFPGRVITVERDTLPDELKRDLSLTPQLLIVEPGGVVQRAFTGALLDDRLKEAESFFGIKLPGHSAEQASSPAARNR